MIIPFSKSKKNSDSRRTAAELAGIRSRAGNRRHWYFLRLRGYRSDAIRFSRKLSEFEVNRILFKVFPLLVTIAIPLRRQAVLRKARVPAG